MKKFRYKKDRKKIKIIVLVLISLLLFILISLYQLKKSHHGLVINLLDQFNSQRTYNLSFLTSNLDQLFNSYAFNDKRLSIIEEKPIIYLYNTHDNETYSDNTTVYDAARLLKNNLTKLGISTIQEENKVSSLIHTGLSYYDISRSFINDVIKTNQNIAYFIDIHRDSVKDTTVKINDKKYAKILFVLGLENKNYLKNKALMLKMNEYLNKNYPKISRGILEKKGSGVDGVYNQDISDNVILIEIGGVENNMEEVNNSTEIVALMLYHMLGD